MTDTYTKDDDALVVRFNSECVRVEAWGPDALRVRARPGGKVAEPHVCALLAATPTRPSIVIDGKHASIRNGRIEARVRLARRLGADVHLEPVIGFHDTVTGEELLSEARSHFAGPPARRFKPISSGSFQLEATFTAHDDEHLMGLGQPQHGRENLKATSTNLVQQNTHVVVPFVISSRGYGFLWNNPAAGRAEFASNITRWRADATPGLDYWITAGETPERILRTYIAATGLPPACPDWVTRFWQSKLRYRSQEEVVNVARGYRKRGIPLSCIVIDFFAWTRQGEWEFDPAKWPDPEGLVRELDEMGVKTIVSIWPTVGANAKYFAEMREKGYLLRTERGVPAVIQFPDKDPFGVHFLTYYDAFNPDARDFHWDKVRRSYLDRGISNFWLDACEPEIRPADAENVRTHLGNGAEMLSAYPLVHAKRFAEGLKAAGADDAVLLGRSTWAGGGSTIRSSFGPATSGRHGRTTAPRSLRDCPRRCRESAGGRPISADSTRATPTIPNFPNSLSAGSNSACSRRSVGCTACGSRTVFLSHPPTAKSTMGESSSTSSLTRAATTRSGATDPRWKRS